MKKLAFLLLALGVFNPASAAPPAHAHLHPYHITPVSWIVKTRNNINVDDRYVTLVGHVTRAIGSEEYWFTDGTGSIRLDSENFDLPVGRRIVVGGRIDQAYLGFGHIEVDVRNWHYAPVRHVVVTRKITTTTTAPAPAPAASTVTTSTSSTTTTPPSEPAPAPVQQAVPSASSASNQPASSPLTPPQESH